MSKYLSHWSALCVMNIPFLKDSSFDPVIRRHTRRRHYVVFSRRHRYELEGETVHLCTQKLPEGALRTYIGRPCVGPEFAFLQVAHDLSFHRLVLLGLLMCATPKGRSFKPVTTSEKLIAFALSMKRHRGRRRALRALQYVEGYSRSPMEALTYMLLCLPNHAGGAGFRGGEFDYRIDLSSEDKKRLGWECVYADIAFPEQGVLIEYYGEKDHTKMSDRTYDAKKVEVLEGMGYRVITVVADELYKEYKLYALIKEVSEALGKPIRMEARTYADGFARIRDLLPRRRRKSLPEDEDPNSFLQAALKRFRRFFEWMGVVPALQRCG